MNRYASRLDNTLFTDTAHGVEECFQQLRNYFADLGKSLQIKDEHIELLKKRCEKLSNVVKLQQDELTALQVVNACRTTDESGNASKLNMALNSEDLMDTTSSNTMSPNANERIAETENMRSPRIFHGTSMRERSVKLGLKELDNNRQERELKEGEISGLKKQPSSWLKKESQKTTEVWGAQFLKPKMEQKKLTALSLSRKAGKTKLKQTRLQLQAAPISSSKSMFASKNSPNPLLTRAKSTFPSCKPTSDDTDEEILFSPPVVNTKPANKSDFRLNSVSGSTNLATVKRDLFSANCTKFDKDDDTESVVEIPPISQEIIFLDDTTESEPQEEASQAYEACIKQEKETQNLSTADETRLDVNDLREKVETDANVAVYEEESSEEFMVRPMVFKEEPSSVETTPCKRSALERFPTKCDDCKMYLQLYGHKKTDEEIKSHLDSCLHSLRPLTPEGFWNPLLDSFPAGDPRNETLIDTRFVGKKRKGFN